MLLLLDEAIDCRVYFFYDDLMRFECHFCLYFFLNGFAEVVLCICLKVFHFFNLLSQSLKGAGMFFFLLRCCGC